MDLGGRRRAGGKGSSVVAAGSVWETRMKSDEVRGGFKVFNGEYCSNNEDEINAEIDGGGDSSKRLSLKKGQTTGGVAVSGKRKTWNDGIEKNQIQIGRSKPEPRIGNGSSKRTPVLPRKERSDQGGERSPSQMKKVTADVMGKVKSDSVKIPDVKNSDQLKNVKSDNIKAQDDADKNGSWCEDSDDKQGLVETEKSGSEENCKEFGVISTAPTQPIDEEEHGENCKEFRVISTPPTQQIDEEEEDEDDGEDEEDEEFYEEEEEEEEDEEEREELDLEEGESEKRVVIKEVDHVQEQKTPVSVLSVGLVEEQKSVKVANQFRDKTQPFSSTLHKQPPPPIVKRATPIYTSPPPPAKPTPFSGDRHGFPQTQNKLQNLVDLIMWRDVSKSAFIFGIGTFMIISSSYTKDLNISFISVISYLGLVYLAANFLYRSLICRGIVDMDDRSYVVGEEEAVWLLKLFLPYLNEFLLKLKALFSGDPSTTMKLAVLLFVLARCGNSITIWKMAKLGFLGVFIIPKACSSYSHQLTAYGKFWVRRFHDAWNSCTHKKAVAILIFTLVWNLSSIVARIWAAFMLFVALRYYKQKVVVEESVEEEAKVVQEGGGRTSTWRGPVGRSRTGLRPSRVEPIKAKKAS